MCLAEGQLGEGRGADAENAEDAKLQIPHCRICIIADSFCAALPRQFGSRGAWPGMRPASPGIAHQAALGFGLTAICPVFFSPFYPTLTRKWRRSWVFPCSLAGSPRKDSRRIALNHGRSAACCTLPRPAALAVRLAFQN